MRIFRGWIIGMMLPVLLVGCAASLDARMARWQQRTERTAAALALRPEADSLAAAGLLNLGQHRDQSLVLIARATAIAPERPELVWLQIQICQAVTFCDPESLEQRLRAIDPLNGATWLGALARAEAAKNDEARDAALAAFSRTDRVDVYWTTLVARLSRATARTGQLSLQEAEVAVIGELAGQAFPTYGTLSNACKGDRLQRAEILQACRGIARALQQGDALITEMIGVAIAKRVWPENSTEWNAANEAKRTYDYRSTLLGTVNSTSWGDLEAEKRLTLCEQHRREQDVVRAQLIAAGKNPYPPQY